MAVGRYFLQLDGIPGDCQETNHQKWIEVDSFTWGSPPGDIRFYEGAADSSVTSLMKACLKGTGIPSGALESTRDDKLFMRLDLSECCVASCQVGAAQGDDPPPVGFTVSYKNIKSTYYLKTNDAPSLPVGWRL
jgi:type VI protein secretion system component Hcp